MLDPDLGFLVEPEAASLPIWTVRPTELHGWLHTLPPAQAQFLHAAGFKAASQELTLLQDSEGLAGVAIGLGECRSPFAFGGLATRLPETQVWRFEPGDYDPSAALLGYCLGAYRFAAFKPGKRSSAPLILDGAMQSSLPAIAATWMVRDLINTPANVLGPAELAEAAMSLAKRYDAAATCSMGDDLERAYPAVAAVGRGSERPPAVVVFTWSPPDLPGGAPLISLCGKGVCFDSGGYDIKPSAGMLRMKKDMGGAATVLGLARMIMESRLPVRLAVRIGCAENSVSGKAMRPLDVLPTRRGLSVEVGNTDAEGRLVLCDLLAEASDERPDLLIDCATLTGAARVALGPNLPALFSNDDGWAGRLLAAGEAVHDPLWRLPLWAGYDSWLDSPIADLGNVSAKPFGGAIVAGLFLQRFVARDVPWAHIDLYAWNDQTTPGRPEGGEAQVMRAVYEAIRRYAIAANLDQNRPVT